MYKRQGRELMSNLFTERVLNMAAVTPQPEDYTGEDGLLYCAVRRLHAPNAGLSGSHILPGGGHAQTGRLAFPGSRLLSECDTCRSKAVRPRPCSPPAVG